MSGRRPRSATRRPARRRGGPADDTPGEVVRIERLAAGGDGVARLADGKTVFLPRTAPGDLVQLGSVRHHARYARARAALLLQPGPGRTEPRCRHYLADDCGGCQWQHLFPELQRDAKRTIVADALHRIGGFQLAVPEVVPSDTDWGYRSRISLTLGPGRRFAGFHPVDHPDRVFPLERCEIAASGLVDLWHRTRPHLHLLPPDAEHLGLRLDRDGGRHLVVHSRGEQAWTRGPQLAERLRPEEVTVWWHPQGGAVRVVAGDRGMSAAPVFEQVNRSLGERIRRLAVELLGPVSGSVVWDLYSGTGETTAALAAAGARVESVELDPAASAIARRRLEGVAGVELHQGRAEELVDRLVPAEAIVANPPRAGLGRPVVEALIRRPGRRLVYVSCDPATLARDLALLCGASDPAGGRPRYRLDRVQAFDLFPQTAHVETVALLEAA